MARGCRGQGPGPASTTMKKVGKNGRVGTIMVYGNDIQALDQYAVRTGYITEQDRQRAELDSACRGMLVRARKEALHDIISALDKAATAENGEGPDVR